MTSTRFNVGMNSDRASSKDDKNNTSSDSESDEDYVPSGKELKYEQEASEEHTDDSEEEAGGPKRGRTSRRRKKREKLDEQPPKEGRKDEEKDDNETSEQPKKAVIVNLDDLWNDFKKDCRSLEPKIAKIAKTTAIAATTAPTDASKDDTAEKCAAVEDKQQVLSASCEPKTKTVTEFFEFAGEAVEVQKEVPINAPTPVTPLPKPRVTTTARGGLGGGLSSVLGQIGKKNKLSVLEKTKLDWDTFKQAEGIKEDLQKYNRGKEGYLEKQDFLQRADLRQFEREKAMRSSSRRLK